jgi:hypothetical protein
MVMGVVRSELLGPHEHGHEVKEEAERSQAGEREVERHGSASGFVAEADIGEREQEQSREYAQPDQVVHR